MGLTQAPLPPPTAAPSPTSRPGSCPFRAAILELFEEQNGSLQELHYLMTVMERLDCASVIQNYLTGTQGGSPPRLRAGAQENQGLELDEKL